MRRGVVLFRVPPARQATILRLARLFIDAGLAWLGHIGILTADGVQMVRSGRR